MYAVITPRLKQGFESVHSWGFGVTARYGLSDFYLGALIKSHAILTESQILLISGR